MRSREWMIGNDWKAEIRKLIFDVQALEQRLDNMKSIDSSPSQLETPGLETMLTPLFGDNSVYGALRHEATGSGGRFIIHLSKKYLTGAFQSEVLGEDESKSICIAIRLKINGLVKKFMSDHQYHDPVEAYWGLKEKDEEPSLRDIMHGKTHKTYSMTNPVKSSDLSVGLNDAMSNMFHHEDEGMQGNTKVMLCRMSVKRDRYIRIHLSKGWNEFLHPAISEGLFKPQSECQLDICEFKIQNDGHSIRIPMKCHYQKSGGSLKFLLPSWFRTLIGEDEYAANKRYACKILHGYSSKLVPNVGFARAIRINPIRMQWKKRNSRNELVFDDHRRLLDELPPEGDGKFVDVEIQIN